MISVNNVSVLFGDYALLDSISFLVNKRDRIGLTGRNGAGKSTLLKILAGVQEPSEGSVSVPSGLKIGYLPQTKVYAEGKTVRKEAETAFNDVLDLQEELELLDVNIRALHILTKLFVKEFRRRNSGILLNVASSAGFLTGPLMASYYASKNYVVRLSLALAEELRRAGSSVSVSVLCPGPVDTNFNNRAGVSFHVQALDSKTVARYAIDGALHGKTILVPGLLMKLSLFGARLVPQKLLAAVTYHIQEQKQKP